MAIFMIVVKTGGRTKENMPSLVPGPYYVPVKVVFLFLLGHCEGTGDRSMVRDGEMKRKGQFTVGWACNPHALLSGLQLLEERGKEWEETAVYVGLS